MRLHRRGDGSALQPVVHPRDGARARGFVPVVRPERVGEVEGRWPAGRRIHRAGAACRLDDAGEREEVTVRRAEQHGARRAQHDVAEVVEAERELAEHELLGVLRTALLAHGADRGEVAARRGARDAVVERHDPRGHRAAAGVAHHAEAGGVHLRTRREYVERAHAVPRAEARRVPAEQLRAAPHVVVRRAVPERRAVTALPPLALVDRIVAERHHAGLRGLERAALVAVRRLAVGGVSARHHDAGTLPRILRGIGEEEVGGHVVSGLALEIELLHRVAVARHASCDDDVQRAPRGKAAQRLDEGGAYLALVRGKLRRRLARGPRLVRREVGLVDGLEHVVVDDAVAAWQKFTVERNGYGVGAQRAQRDARGENSYVGGCRIESFFPNHGFSHGRSPFPFAGVVYHIPRLHRHIYGTSRRAGGHVGRATCDMRRARTTSRRFDLRPSHVVLSHVVRARRMSHVARPPPQCAATMVVPHATGVTRTGGSRWG